jgi:hypothetical protein
MERDGDEISIAYGRGHAPSDDSIVEWNGERCFPWHNLWVLNVTEFLEGFSPSDVLERRRKKIDTPERIAFLETDLGRGLRGPEWGVALEGFVWETYGDRLFSLFDLREPQRWEDLRRFVREYYARQPGLDSLDVFGIPRWNIC